MSLAYPSGTVKLSSPPSRRLRLAASGRRSAPVFWSFDAGAALPSVPFIALVPGADAPLLGLALPDTLRGQPREAVAFRQLHDRLGTDLTTLELRPARLRGLGDNWTRVLIADRAKVTDWRRAVAPAGTLCRAILPDFLALPAAPRVWTVCTAYQTPTQLVQVRLGPLDGFSAEPDLAELALTRALAETDPPAAILRLGPALPAVDAALAGLITVTKAEDLPQGLEPPVALGHGEEVLDLATDPRAHFDTLRGGLLALQLPAVLMLFGALAWSASIALETRGIVGRTAAIADETIAAVRRDFLPVGPVLDIPAQVTRELERRRIAAEAPLPPASPLLVLHQAAETLVASQALLVSAVLLPDRKIGLDVELADFAALEGLVTELRAAGLDVQLGRSATTLEGVVAGTLVLGIGQDR